MTMGDPLVPPANAQSSALVVDDNALVAETIADGLSAIGYKSVEIVGSVNAAINAVGKENIDLAVVEMDVRGESTEQVVKALDETDVPHVIASCHGCGGLPVHALYLQKPFSFSELKSAVTRARELASVRSWDRLH